MRVGLLLAMPLLACGGGGKTRITAAIEGCAADEARLLVFASPAACEEEDPSATAAGRGDPIASTAWLDPDEGPVALDVSISGPVAVVVQCRDGDLVRQWGCGVQQGDAVRVVAAPLCSDRCAPNASCPEGADAWTGGGGSICVARCELCAPGLDAGVDAGAPVDGGGDEDAAVDAGFVCVPPIVGRIPFADGHKALDLARLDADRLLVASGGAGGLRVMLGPLAVLVPADRHDLSEAFGVTGADEYAFVAEGSKAEATHNIELLHVDADGTVSDPQGVIVPGEVHDVEAHVNHLYAAAGSGGLRVFDASSPGSLGEAADIQPPGDVLDVAFLGTRAIVAASDAGVHVVDIADPDAPDLLSTYADATGARAVATDGTSLVLVARGAAGADLLELRADALVLIGHVDTPGDARGVGFGAGRGWIADGAGNLVGVELGAARVVTVAPTPGEDEAIGEDLLVEGTLVAMAAGPDGLYVFDVACLQ